MVALGDCGNIKTWGFIHLNNGRARGQQQTHSYVCIYMITVYIIVFECIYDLHYIFI